MAKQVQEVKGDVKNKLKKANAKYKMEENKHIRFNSFEVGDEVMIFISSA